MYTRIPTFSSMSLTNTVSSPVGPTRCFRCLIARGNTLCLLGEPFRSVESWQIREG